jgi:hypothetical protein
MLVNGTSGLYSRCRRWLRAHCCGGQEQRFRRRSNTLGNRRKTLNLICYIDKIKLNIKTLHEKRNEPSDAF